MPRLRSSAGHTLAPMRATRTPVTTARSDTGNAAQRLRRTVCAVTLLSNAAVSGARPLYCELCAPSEQGISLDIPHPLTIVADDIERIDLTTQLESLLVESIHDGLAFLQTRRARDPDVRNEGEVQSQLSGEWASVEAIM